MNLKLPEKPVYRAIIVFLCFFTLDALLYFLGNKYIFTDSKPHSLTYHIIRTSLSAAQFTLIDYFLAKYIRKRKEHHATKKA